MDIYDTTLRDGSQQEGLSLTVDDKLRVAEQLDHLGVQFIEGGWPGANPKDEEFFRRAAAGELQLHTATLVAFGSTRKAGGRAETDPVLANLLDAQTSAVCLVAKSAEWHVTETLRTTLTEAIDMVADSVAFLGTRGGGCSSTPSTSSTATGPIPVSASMSSGPPRPPGAEVLVLCDTNGGTPAHRGGAHRGRGPRRGRTSGLGCHFHNDSGCAVANSLVAVRRA